jgi:hypothetical protein
MFKLTTLNKLNSPEIMDRELFELIFPYKNSKMQKIHSKHYFSNKMVPLGKK